MLIHAGLLAWSAARHSPVVDEIGHLPAGLSHWKLQRFDLYDVNPPLVRTVATLPLYLMDMPIDFIGYQVLPRHRSEFALGSRWISIHSDSFLQNFTIARWACLPFSLLGAVTVFFWARKLYGLSAGFMALSLWCFCPVILGHGSLITPDVGATGVGIAASYVFRKWLTRRTMVWAVFSGAMLGLALLTKFTWLFLLGLWPVCWIIVRSFVRSPGFSRILPATPATMPPEGGTKNSRLTDPAEVSNVRLTAPKGSWRNDLGQMSLILLLAFWVLNNGYLFEDSFQRLGDFEFFSQSLSDRDPGSASLEGGNRFRGTLLEHLPVPVPRNYLQGIDHIKFEYELGYPSYLHGVKRHRGWWYYYLYAMLVKMPVGTLGLIGVAAAQCLFQFGKPARIGMPALISSVELSLLPKRLGISPPGNDCTRRSDTLPLAEGFGSDWCETLYLLAPTIAILWLVSSQTGFNHHLRYVLPAFPFLFIFASRTALLLNSRWRLLRLLPVVCVAGTIISSLSVYPHSLSYFNELSGGSINGWKHLDNSNIDWGQDLILVREWAEAHPDAKPLYVLTTGFVTPKQMGIKSLPLPMTTQPSPDGESLSNELAPGWYIVGLTRLVDPDSSCHELLKRAPDDYIGYSMRIYHVQPNDGNESDVRDVGPDSQR